MAERIYSVSQVNFYIKDLFQTDPMLRSIVVRGELSNVKYHTSGHIYFTLKDEKGQIAGVMFAGSRSTGLRFRMEEGQRVLVTGQVSVYERDGRYQIYARKIELDGIGRAAEGEVIRRRTLCAGTEETDSALPGAGRHRDGCDGGGDP